VKPTVKTGYKELCAVYFPFTQGPRTPRGISTEWDISASCVHWACWFTGP